MKTKPITLIFVGSKYYDESNTRMGVLYTEKWKRSDWGQVQCFLKAGKKVVIRPAKTAELKLVERVLCSLKEQDKKIK